MRIIARFWKLEIAFSWKARIFSACNWHCQFEMSPVLLSFGLSISIWCYHITINKCDTLNRKHIRINFKNTQTGILLRVQGTYRIADEKLFYFLHIFMEIFGSLHFLTSVYISSMVIESIVFQLFSPHTQSIIQFYFKHFLKATDTAFKCSTYVKKN